MAPKKYQKALSATAQKAALVARIAKRSRASVDNVDIPSVPAQTHNNDLLVIKSWARVLNRGIMGPKGGWHYSQLRCDIWTLRRQLEQSRIWVIVWVRWTRCRDGMMKKLGKMCKNNQTKYTQSLWREKWLRYWYGNKVVYNYSNI